MKIGEVITILCHAFPEYSFTPGKYWEIDEKQNPAEMKYCWSYHAIQEIFLLLLKFTKQYSIKIS